MKSPILAALIAATLSLSAVTVASATTVNFSSLAGQGVVLDHTDGNGTSALFFNPQSVAIDTAGNVYVADSGDHTVRKITPAGQSSVLAGASGLAGNLDATGGAARFDSPYALAVGPDSSVYVTDVIDGTVRKITPAGAVTTIATGLNGPQGVAVDPTGIVYISDTNNSSIKKIGGSGLMLFAGSLTNTPGSADGAGQSALFNFPAGLATDTAGNVYVADFGNSSIRMITPAGQVTTIAGSTTGASGYSNNPGTAALFNHPAALAVDANKNIYVVDTSNQLIREVTAGTYTVATVAGSFSNITNSGVIGSTNAASATTSTFFYPQGITVNAAGTAIFIADTGSHKIREITGGNFSAGTATVSTYAGSIGASGATNTVASQSTFKAPYGVAVDASGNIFIADQGNNLIRQISGGNASTLAGTAGLSGANNGPGASATFNNPSGVAADNQGNVYVADSGNGAVRKIVVGTKAVTTLATGFSNPEGIATDAAGNVYVADTGNNAVKLVTPTGAVSTIATGFSGPNALVVDGSGNVYVSDFKNDVIKKLTKSGTTYAVSVLAGTAGVVGDVDGANASARFNNVNGIAVDSSGNVYVTDTLNRVVRQISTGGAVSTVTGTQARFFYPEGIAIDSGNNIYVVDADNNSLSAGAIPSAISTGLANHTVAPNGTATFSLLSPTPGATFQWQVSTNGVSWTNVANGGMYSGATTSSLTITGATTAMDNTQYRAVTNGTPGPAGTLYVGNVRLLNLSSSGFVGTGATNLDAGFIIGGSGNKSILLRGIGPSLAQFSGTATLATPMLILDQGAAGQQTNTVWGGGAILANAMTATGAFTLAANSADSAILTPLTGSHTAIVQSASTSTGPALVEVYDADSGTPSSRLTNISTRAVLGTANLVAGFVIGGTTSETVLIRGIGPGLAAFSVPNTVSGVVLTVNDHTGAQIAQNAGWSNGSNAAQLAATFTQVAAFSLTAGSSDAAVLLTLAPGSYTATVGGAGGAAGAAMVEIYEVP